MRKKAKTTRKKLDSYYYKDLEPTKIKAADKRLLLTYGITTLDYDKMFKEQEERCWICQREPTTIRFSVDHRHVKGYKGLTQKEKRQEVRGLLCFGCNTGLKGFEKTNDGALNRRRLLRTALYFQKFKLKGE